MELDGSIFEIDEDAEYINALLDRHILALGGGNGPTITHDGEPICSEREMLLRFKARIVQQATNRRLGRR